MKNSLIFLLIFTVLFPGLTNANAKTKELEIRIDDVTLAYNSQKPEIVNGVFMSPYTPVLKQMNLKYEWDAKDQTLTIENKKIKLRLNIGSPKALLNGKSFTLAANPQLRKGNIYIPVVSVARAFGAQVQIWDSNPSSRILVISYADHGKMIRALVNNDYSMVKKLIDDGIDLKYVDKDKKNYLHHAASFSSVQINRLLLESGVPVNQLDKYDFTPLIPAILFSNEDVVKLLAPYTDLSYKIPPMNNSYLDYAKSEVESKKKYGREDTLKQAESIVAYLEEVMGVSLSADVSSTSSSDVSSKSPADVGQTVITNITVSSNNKKSIGITVEKVLSGSQAWKKVAESSSFNSRPTEGKEYLAILVRIDLDYDTKKFTSTYDVPSKYDFYLADDKGVGYYQPNLYSTPSPQFDIRLDDKKDTTSWLIYSVPENVALDNLILSYREAKSKDSVYFRLRITPEVDKTVDLSQVQLPATISSTPTVNELNMILNQNFSTVYNTSQGDLSLQYDVRKNDLSSVPYDYFINSKVESAKYYDLQYGNSITEEQRKLTFQQLKDHQEKIGLTLTALYPNVKFTGSYYESWYKYPHLKVGFNSKSLYEWSNYDVPTSLTNSYYETKPSFFRWKN
ncbi:stalk domain-containing protein [Bacillus sp. FJAT-27264]|uniref:stalk domain-containing protein n=1 Tax=Paenibacillus sp. (strain DSM 101736 / FJAT-27264) TaxID=1850362 RepID=UPI0011122DBC|nr:stalk domain-containing protein [Bacillus sp. FJAT-27264]